MYIKKNLTKFCLIQLNSVSSREENVKRLKRKHLMNIEPNLPRWPRFEHIFLVDMLYYSTEASSLTKVLMTLNLTELNFQEWGRHARHAVFTIQYFFCSSQSVFNSTQSLTNNLSFNMYWNIYFFEGSGWNSNCAFTSEINTACSINKSKFGKMFDMWLQ